MKKILLTITLALTMMSANATENQLSTVVLEGTDVGYNIILRSDTLAKVKKTVQAKDKITLELKGITSTNTVNTLYKNTSAVNSLIVEKIGNDDLKIYIQANDISDAAVIFETPAAPPVFVSDGISKDKIAWAGFVFVLLVCIIASTKTLKAEPELPSIAADIKKRELEMYRNFKREMASKPSINYKIRNEYVSNTISSRASRRTIRQLEKVS